VKNEVKELLLSWEKESISNLLVIEVVELGKEIQRFSYTPQEETDAVATFGEAENT